MLNYRSFLRGLRCLRKFCRLGRVSWDVSISITDLARVGRRVRAIIFFSAVALK